MRARIHEPLFHRCLFYTVPYVYYPNGMRRINVPSQDRDRGRERLDSILWSTRAHLHRHEPTTHTMLREHFDSFCSKIWSICAYTAHHTQSVINVKRQCSESQRRRKKNRERRSWKRNWNCEKEKSIWIYTHTRIPNSVFVRSGGRPSQSVSYVKIAAL